MKDKARQLATVHISCVLNLHSHKTNTLAVFSVANIICSRGSKLANGGDQFKLQRATIEKLSLNKKKENANGRQR